MTQHRLTLYSVNAHDRQSALRYASYVHCTSHYTMLVTFKTDSKNHYATHTHAHKTYKTVYQFRYSCVNWCWTMPC